MTKDKQRYTRGRWHRSHNLTVPIFNFLQSPIYVAVVRFSAKYLFPQLGMFAIFHAIETLYQHLTAFMRVTVYTLYYTEKHFINFNRFCSANSFIAAQKWILNADIISSILE